MDGFSPIGPAIVTPDELGDPHNLGIRCTVNGVTKQNSNTNQVMKMKELEWSPISDHNKTVSCSSWCSTPRRLSHGAPSCSPSFPAILSWQGLHQVSGFSWSPRSSSRQVHKGMKWFRFLQSWNVISERGCGGVFYRRDRHCQEHRGLRSGFYHALT